MNKRIYESTNFILSLEKLNRKTQIQMEVLVPFVNTRALPHTYTFLEENFPDVLSTECFNELNLPFHVEVKATELGHLFEHILLVNICNLKTSKGAKNVVVNGRTDWNWVRDAEGIFHIIIDIGKKDVEYLIEALKKTIHLFESLFSSPVVAPRFAFSFA